MKTWRAHAHKFLWSNTPERSGRAKITRQTYLVQVGQSFSLLYMLGTIVLKRATLGLSQLKKRFDCVASWSTASRVRLCQQTITGEGHPSDHSSIGGQHHSAAHTRQSPPLRFGYQSVESETSPADFRFLPSGAFPAKCGISGGPILSFPKTARKPFEQKQRGFNFGLAVHGLVVEEPVARWGLSEAARPVLRPNV